MTTLTIIFQLRISQEVYYHFKRKGERVIKFFKYLIYKFQYHFLLDDAGRWAHRNLTDEDRREMFPDDKEG